MSSIFNLPQILMSQLQSIDPYLDVNWQQNLSEIYHQIEPENRTLAYERLILSRGIHWNEMTNQFEASINATIEELATANYHHSLKNFIINLQKTKKILEATQDAAIFANILESCLSSIDRFDAEDNLLVQQAHLHLRKAFLYEVAECVKKNEFIIPENQRNLTSDMVRTYILEIFIKQQIQKYNFRSLSAHALSSHENPFIQKTIAEEAKVRQFELVYSTKYFFLIGPALKADQNPYSVRRFLTEDKALEGRIIYLTHVVIPKDILFDLEAQKKALWEISRMFTVERQLSQGVINFIRSMDDLQDRYLLSLLQRPIKADGTELEIAIKRRLYDYEKNLSILILKKIPHILKTQTQTRDDYDYLFFSLRRLIQELLSNVNDFSSQSLATWSEVPSKLVLRLVCYLSLLDKSQDFIFSIDSAQRADPLRDPILPLNAIDQILEIAETEMEALKVMLTDAIQYIEQPVRQNFFAKMFFKPVDQCTPLEIEDRILDLKSRTMISIIRTVKKYPKTTVYPEFECGYSLSDQKRHYAFQDGELGIGLLPKLIELPEDRQQFDLQSVKQTLDFDIFVALQEWDLSES